MDSGKSINRPIIMSSEFAIAGEAFYKTLIGEANYARWQYMKEETQFHSQTEFVTWMLDIVESNYAMSDRLSTGRSSHASSSKVKDGGVNGQQNHVGNELKNCSELGSLQPCKSDSQNRVSPGTEVARSMNKRKLFQPINKRAKLYENQMVENADKYEERAFDCLEDTKPANVDEISVRDESVGVISTFPMDSLGNENELTEVKLNEDEMKDEGEVSSFAPTNNIECKICGQVSVTGMQFLEHIQQKHEHLTDGEKDCLRQTLAECNLSCVFCGRIIANRNNMQQHIKCTHLNLNVTCEVCGKEFTSGRNLNRHKMTVHLGIRNFPCPYCVDAFKRSHHLARHIERRHGTTPNAATGAPAAAVGGGDVVAAAGPSTVSPADNDEVGMYYLGSDDDDDSLDDTAIPSLHDATPPRSATVPPLPPPPHTLNMITPRQ